MTPADILNERLSDLALARHKDPATLDALFALALVAIPCVLQTAAAGNVRCLAAQELMKPHFKTLGIK